LKNPVFNISWADKYTLNFTATSGGGSGSSNNTVILAKNLAPTARFSQTALNWTNTTTSLTFTDTSTGANITQWLWDVVNNNHSNKSESQNPTYQFACNAADLSNADSCLYDLNLLVNDSAGSIWNVSSAWWNQSSWVRVYQNSSPSFSFTGTPLSGTNPLSVSFEAFPAGTIKIDSYLWIFGDGTTSSTTFPTVNKQYVTAGQFSVTLNAWNWTLGNATQTKLGYVTVSNPAPVVNIPSISPRNWTNTTTPLTFTDSSSGTNIDGWAWQWLPENNASNTQSPVRTFPCNNAPSCIFDMNHSAVDSSGTPWEITTWRNMTSWATIYANSSPTIGVASDVQSGLAPLTVHFTAVEYGAIKVDAWVWALGDGSSGYGPAPIYVYNNAGQYTVTLTGTNYTLGQSQVVTDKLILVQNPKPTAAFSGSPLLGNTTTEIQFTDASSGANVTGWDWDFGDTGTSALQNPTHIYSGASADTLYSVTLTATDSADTPWANSSAPLTKTDYITIYLNATPTVSFTGTPLSGQRPLDVQFNATPAGIIEVDSWSWDFGDGNTSAVQNASNTFPDAGQYLVTLTATNYTLGQTVVSKTDYVTVTNPAPIAGWSNAPSYANATTEIQFTDTSSSTNLTADSHFWDFNDGNTSTAQDPLHVFPCNTGEVCAYTINKSTMDSPGTPWAVASWLNKTTWVTVYANLTLTVTFTEDIVTGEVPFVVTFNGTSYGVIEVDSWAWDFGDTGAASGQNTSHQYTVAGLYSVSLAAVNFTLGESTVLKTDLIVATNPKPIAIANATPSTANQTVDVYFVDSSTGANITKWTWDFRDGNTSAAKNPTNRFPSPGVYQVIHNVTDSPGTPWEVVSDDVYITVTVVNNSVSGDFTGIPTVGTVSFWVHFTWTGTGGPEENHTWDFGDGNTSTAGPDVWHLYEVTGTFWVNISVCNDAGCTFVNKSNYITANPHGGGGAPTPTADFSGTPLSGSVPLDVAFTDLSDCYGCLVWSWDFGDTGTSPLPNPSHTYTGPGLYAVTLMVVNASGSDTKTVPNYITVGQFSVDFVANVTMSPAPPLSVQFVATPTVDHVIDDWYWEFGDGNLDIVQNPVNTYITAGSFTVRLRIRNVTDILESWQNKTGYINILDLNQTLKMSGDIGDSWIKWEWKENVTSNATPPRPVDLYLDGSPNEVNYTPPYFYFQGLDPNSEHRLEIRDNITQLVLARSTLRTTPQEEMVLLILVFCAVLAAVTILQNDAKAMVTGTIGVVLASYGRSIAYNYYGLDWVFLAFAVGMIAVVVYMVIGIVREKLAWH